MQILQEMGFRVKEFQEQGSSAPYLAADDRCRLDGLHALLTDTDVQALLALRGGFGCLRIADRIDFDLIRTSRKFIIGFSDISVLLNAVNSRSGLVSIHGPVLTTLAVSDRRSTDSLLALLTRPLPATISTAGAVVLRPGRASGILRGGNLTTLVHLLGTPWEICWDQTLLLLEDTGEPMYKIDRMLTQLQLAGKLGRLAGILLGTFDGAGDQQGNRALQEQVARRVLELTEQEATPVWSNVPVGHCRWNMALPLGVSMTMNSDSVELKLDADRADC